jgi:hypothetical protein
MATGRPNLNNREYQELGEFLTKYEDIFAGDSADYGRKNKVYHRIGTGDARPISQQPRSLPLAKQADVKQIRAITVWVGAGRNAVALRTELLNDPDIEPILQELEAGQPPE